MLSMMKDYGVKGFVTKPSNLGDIKGDSWEMAAVMGMLGRPGAFTGTLHSYDGKRAIFGPVRGVDVKRTLYDNLISFSDIPSVRIFPGVPL